MMELVLYPGKKRCSSNCKESCSLTVYVHCSPHVLNLVLVKSCATPKIHSTFDFVEDIAIFFKSVKKFTINNCDQKYERSNHQ